MAEERICPILSDAGNLISCKKNDCMWFFQADSQAKGKGSCAVSEIGNQIGLLRTWLNMRRSSFDLPKK